MLAISVILYIDSVNDNSYAQSSGSGSSYLTSTVTNGQNENDTEILDFEYRFPVDNSSGDATHRSFAPLSSPNGQWDTERSANNEAASMVV